MKKILDHSLLDGTSRETTNVDDIMHIALVDAAVATASLNGTLGVAEVIHVQLLEKRKICVIKQRIDLLLRGRRQNTLGSFALCSKTALGTMIFSQILHLRRAFAVEVAACTAAPKNGEMGLLGPSH